MFYLFFYMYMMALLSLITSRKHVFLCLMSLEFIIIALMLMLMNFLLFFNSSFYLMIFCMVFFVCEAVLGLSVLVSMIRYFGNDYIMSMSLW